MSVDCNQREMVQDDDGLCSPMNDDVYLCITMHTGVD